MALQEITKYKVHRRENKRITRWTVEIKEAVEDMWPNKEIIHRNM